MSADTDQARARENPDILLDFCKAAADALRLDILRVLSVESFGVSELARIMAVPQPGMSHHLKILTAGGLLVTRREGNSIFYRRALVIMDSPIANLQSDLYLALDRRQIPTEIGNRMAAVHRERAERSRAFFAKHAGKFRENQGLIASFSQYAKPVADWISNERLEGDAIALEVGPGEGELLLHLSQLFDRVIALDNSPEMLGRARATCEQQGKTNIDFIQGEIATAVDQGIRADLLILNMVLHHMASPAAIFDQAGKLLNPRGRLVIIDLCSHDQDWVRESCGDLWLGFEPDDLANWGKNAALKRGQSVYLALRNGFQIQMQLFSSNASDP